MTAALATIEAQIRQCQNLLGVFQNEREFILKSDRLALSSLLPFWEKKKEMVTVLGDHRRLAAQAGPGPDKDRQQQLLRRLAALLEQLLVIDRENEVLLRQLLDRQRGTLPVGLPTNAGIQQPSRPAVVKAVFPRLAPAPQATSSRPGATGAGQRTARARAALAQYV
jgi:hypothetical protein